MTHLVGILPIGIVYMILNFSVSIYRQSNGQKAVYPIMDWKSPLGIFLPIFSFFLGFLTHYLLNRLNIYKY